MAKLSFNFLYIVIASLRKKFQILKKKTLQNKHEYIYIPEIHSKVPSTKNGCHLINIILCHH